MSICGLNTFNTPYFGGLNSFIPQMTLPWFGSFTPRFSIFDNNIFGITPQAESFSAPYFGYMPPNSFMMPFNFLPQFDFSGLSCIFSKPQECQTATPYGMFDFLDITKSSRKPSKHSQTAPSVKKALELAKSELRRGAHENGETNDSADVRRYKNGAINNSAWCASFASWLFGAGQNSNNSDTFGYSAKSQTIRERAEQAGHYAKKNSGYKPQVGDLMIIKNSGNGGHIGIITEINGDEFTTIEGNYGNKVSQVRRSMNTENLHGFVKMNEWLEAA